MTLEPSHRSTLETGATGRLLSATATGPSRSRAIADSDSSSGFLFALDPDFGARRQNKGSKKVKIKNQERDGAHKRPRSSIETTRSGCDTTPLRTKSPFDSKTAFAITWTSALHILLFGRRFANGDQGQRIRK